MTWGRGLPIKRPRPADDRFFGLDKVVPRIVGGIRQPLNPNESTRRQIRRAQLKQSAIAAQKMLELMQIGKTTPDTIDLIARAFLTAGECGAELEDTAAGREPWLEERVVALWIVALDRGPAGRAGRRRQGCLARGDHSHSRAPFFHS